MQTSIPYTYKFQGSSSLNLVEAEDGDLIIEVHRTSEGLFEDEYFDVNVIRKGSKIILDPHELFTELSRGEKAAMKKMVEEHLKSKTQ